MKFPLASMIPTFQHHYCTIIDIESGLWKCQNYVTQGAIAAIALEDDKESQYRFWWVIHPIRVRRLNGEYDRSRSNHAISYPLLFAAK